MASFADKFWIGVKQLYLRITLTPSTAIFFLLTFGHCFAQGLIQSFLFGVDDSASNLVTSILTAAEVPFHDEFAWLTRSQSSNENGGHQTDFLLQLCTHIPDGESAVYPCVSVFDTSHDVGVVPANMRRDDDASLNGPIALLNHAVVEALVPAVSRGPDGNITGVSVVFSGSPKPVFLSEQCTRVLVYPDQVLKNAKREDLAIIGSQFWLFIVSFYGIAYESIPHILAGLCTRILATGWSAYAIWRTDDIHVRFNALVIDPASPCGVDLFPQYFHQRFVYEVPDLVLNCTALLFTAFLSWRLIKLYMSQTFQYVCPTPEVLRKYRFFMAAAVNFQLAIFFLTTAMSLWIDQLANSALAKISSHTAVYQAECIVTGIIMLPWIAFGWHGLTRERREMTFAVLAIAFVLVASWSIMFYSRVYRWTFLQWPFFACMTVASFIVILLAAGWTTVCLSHFGQGLGAHLKVSRDLAKCDFEPDVFRTDPNAPGDDRAEKGSLRSSTSKVDNEDGFWDKVYEGEVRHPPVAYLPPLRFGDESSTESL